MKFHLLKWVSEWTCRRVSHENISRDLAYSFFYYKPRKQKRRRKRRRRIIGDKQVETRQRCNSQTWEMWVYELSQKITFIKVTDTSNAFYAQMDENVQFWLYFDRLCTAFLSGPSCWLVSSLSDVKLVWTHNFTSTHWSVNIRLLHTCVNAMRWSSHMKRWVKNAQNLKNIRSCSSHASKKIFV